MSEPGQTDFSLKLPDDFEGRDEIVKNFPTTDKLAKSYGELRKSAVFLPKEDDPEREAKITKIRQRLGDVPESPDGYDVKVGDDLKPLFGDLKKFKETALKGGTPKKAFESLISTLSEDVAASRKAINEAKQQWQEELKKAGAENYEANLGRAQRIAKDLIAKDPRIGRVLDASGLGDHEFIHNMLVSIFNIVKPDDFHLGDGGEKNMDETATNAKKARERIMAIRGTPEWKLAPHMEQKKALTAEVTRLTKALTDAGFEGVFDARLKEPA